MTPVDPGAPIDGYEPPPYTDPPIYDDTATYDEIVQSSYDQFYRILLDYPEYTSQLHPDIYKIVNLKQVTNTGIRVFQFNKIRILLDKIHRLHGFHAHRDRTITFFNLIMFAIPFHHLIHIHYTKEAWKNEVGMCWRAVKIYQTAVHGTVAGATASVIDGFLSVFGLRDVVEGVITEETMVNWGIFENMVTYGGIHNMLIISNWDKIVQKLNENGY